VKSSESAFQEDASIGKEKAIALQLLKRNLQPLGVSQVILGGSVSLFLR